MRHTVRIGISPKTPQVEIVRCRRINLREKFLRILFGNKRQLMIILPGESVQTLTISEIEKEGGEPDGNRT